MAARPVQGGLCMVMAIALIVIVVGSVLFHFLSPWVATPLASNWHQMDATLTITLVITGVFFIGINLFVVWTLLRYRHKEGLRAAYEPNNHKLERRLTLFTSIGIMALLAPGLFVYAEYVEPPKDALVMEVLGQQWQWRYRFPGPSGKLGLTDPRFVAGNNPFGIDPGGPNGREDIVVNSNEVHLPLGRPVKVLLRSHDVLHDFFAPPFRARMNMVPGMVTSFWFTPTQVGRFEVLCAQLCGMGHSNMRGYVVVDEPQKFAAWLKEQPTHAMALAPPAAAAVAAAPGDRVANGKALAQSKGCVACHTVDGSAGVGPTWKGLFGKTETMADGSTAKVDEAYIHDFIRNPSARVVKGFQPIMPKLDVSDEEMAALTAYIASLGGGAARP